MLFCSNSLSIVRMMCSLCVFRLFVKNEKYLNEKRMIFNSFYRVEISIESKIQKGEDVSFN